ncbi:hypothetical protein FA13DRAFT_1708330 [Coprinellus micaceus]|uniref:Uncharacterized protein n=1 Tax=Coprinellus micaceus TaxID=71717 RepID=A0A4Y7TJ38_COPMI|nr:hypothetical protein FA13DRAFT_1708330 [Coprinellus micaceus]
MSSRSNSSSENLLYSDCASNCFSSPPSSPEGAGTLRVRFASPTDVPGRAILAGSRSSTGATRTTRLSRSGSLRLRRPIEGLRERFLRDSARTGRRRTPVPSPMRAERREESRSRESDDGVEEMDSTEERSADEDSWSNQDAVVSALTQQQRVFLQARDAFQERGLGTVWLWVMSSLNGGASGNDESTNNRELHPDWSTGGPRKFESFRKRRDD